MRFPGDEFDAYAEIMMSFLSKDNQLRHKFADEEGLAGGVQSLAVYKLDFQNCKLSH